MMKSILFWLLATAIVNFCTRRRRRRAARKNLPHRFPGSKHCFWYGRAFEGVPARAEQVWLDRGKNIAIEYRFAEKNLSACLSLRRIWFVLKLI